MDLSAWSEISDQSDEYNKSIQEFINSLFTLANHWRGKEGVELIKKRVEDNKINGLPLPESLVEAYQYLRPKVI